MKIAIGSDHRGAKAVAALREHLAQGGHEVVVLGPTSGDSWDYPDVAWLVGRAVAGGEAALGMLVCGSGIGASIAANKVEGVRAALAQDETAAEMSRRHNDANLLCLAGDRLADEQVCAIAERFLAGTFEGGRHERRVRKIAAIERGEDPASILRSSDVS